MSFLSKFFSKNSRVPKLFLISFIGVVSFFFITFSVSCNSKEKFSSEGSKQKITLALRSGLYSDVIKSCLRDFEKANNVVCEVQDFSEDDLHKAVLESNGNIDFCMADSSWQAEFTAKGILANLSEYGYELDEDIIKATKTICYYKDNVYLAPYYGNVTVLLYNKLMFEEAGYKPTDIISVEDMLKICRTAKKRHNLGFMYRGDTENNVVVDFLPILLSFGGWVVDENNYPTVAGPKFEKAVNTYLELIKTGRQAKKEDLVAAIANKAACMGIGWPGWYTPTKNSSMDYIAFSGKRAKKAIPYNSNIYGIWTIGVPESSKNKEIAVKLLEHLMDKDVQKATVEKGGVPCRYSSLGDSEIQAKFPQYKVVLEALEGGVYRPVMQEWSEFYTILGKHLKEIFNGETEVKKGIRSAQLELEELLSKKID